MRSVLADEFTGDEADNALTALSTLTSLFPELFPSHRTFVRPDHQTPHMRATGVRFVVYGDQGIVRQIRIPRMCLVSVSEAVDVAGIMVSVLTYQESKEDVA